jgi:hypothetical protein
MRLSAITFAATVALATTSLVGLGLATAQSAPPGAPAAVSASPSATPEVSARLVRLGADIKGGVRQGWLSPSKADQLTDRLKAMKTIVAKKTKDGGQLSERDVRRLQAELADLHQEMGDIAAAARERRRRG